MLCYVMLSPFLCHCHNDRQLATISMCVIF